MGLPYVLTRVTDAKTGFWDFLEENLKTSYFDLLPALVSSQCSQPRGCLYVCEERNPKECLILQWPNFALSEYFAAEAEMTAVKISLARAGTNDFWIARSGIGHGLVMKFLGGGAQYAFILCTDEASRDLLSAGLLHTFSLFKAPMDKLNILGEGNIFWGALCKPKVLN